MCPPCAQHGAQQSGGEHERPSRAHPLGSFSGVGGRKEFKSRAGSKSGSLLGDRAAQEKGGTEERETPDGRAESGGDPRMPPGGGGAGPASFSSRSPWLLGLGWGCRKVALWVSPSSCGQVIPGLQAGEMIPPEGQAWSLSGRFPCENAQQPWRLGVLRSSMNHSFLNLSKCVYKIKLRPRAAPGGVGR